jgi:D-glycero-D-manno-heptose 1,7-bisphosphate phosphatase
MKNKALFLDRDGVINIDNSGYTYKIEEVIFIDGIFELCKTAQNLGYLIIIVTNQSGIGRGYYSEEDFQNITNYMLQEFSKHGIKITEIYHSPHHPTHGIGEYMLDSPDRKPKPGMLLKAQDKYNIDMQNSIMIGDKNADIIAGQKAGVGKLIYFSNVGENNTANYNTKTHIENIEILDTAS